MNSKKFFLSVNTIKNKEIEESKKNILYDFINKPDSKEIALKKVYLKNIKHYFLTIDSNGIKKKHMIKEFNEYNLIEVNPVINIPKYQSGPIGFSRMIDIGLRNQDKNSPFQPFIMYEDDCSKYRNFPEYIEIPEDTDLLYIGLSKLSLGDKAHQANYYDFINDNVIKIYNMLATHGIMVCSASGALAIQKAVMEAYFINKIWDVPLACIQPHYNIYALTIPLVFQDSKFKGDESPTKFSIKPTSNSVIPINFINHNNVSVIMCKKLNNV
jgi:hypothetical protein